VRRTPALIVGGGPAGAVAALLLARAKADHVLIERDATVGDALCGGFLSWRTLDTLAALGIDAEALNPVAVTRVRLFAGGRMTEAPLPRPARGVSRRRLDSVLLAHAGAAGAAIERGIVAAEARPGAIRLRDGAELAADALFLATGKHELRGLARPEAARGRDPSLGLRIRLAAAPALDRLVGDAIELHLVDRGYAGLVRQEDGSVNLCMAIHRSRLAAAGSPAALLGALGRDHPALGERLAWWPGGAVDAVANVPYGWRQHSGAPGLFRLGDQAGVIPSLAGEGIGIAIASGVRAARAYLDGGASAAPAYQRALARDLARPMAIASLVRRAAEAPVIAPGLIGLARLAPGLIQVIARLTRLGHSSID
jgi:flavin-dependent dehydrogenase